MAKKLISIDDSKTGEAALPEAVNAALRNTYAPIGSVGGGDSQGSLNLADYLTEGATATQNRTEIGTAIAAAASAGKDLCCDGVDVSISGDPIEVTQSNIRIWGSNPAHARITQTTKPSGIFHVTGTDVTIEGLHFDGNNDTLDFTGSTESDIDNLSFGVKIGTGAHRFRVRRCTAKGLFKAVQIMSHPREHTGTWTNLRDGIVEDVAVEKCWAAVWAYGVSRLRMHRITGQYQKAVGQGGPAHLIYLTTSFEADNHTPKNFWNYDVSVTDCHAFDGTYGGAYSLRATKGLTASNLRTTNCQGTLDAIALQDFTIGSVTATEDVYPDYGQATTLNGDRGAFSLWQCHRGTVAPVVIDFAAGHNSGTGFNITDCTYVTATRPQISYRRGAVATGVPAGVIIASDKCQVVEPSVQSFDQNVLYGILVGGPNNTAMSEVINPRVSGAVQHGTRFLANGAGSRLEYDVTRLTGLTRSVTVDGSITTPFPTLVNLKSGVRYDGDPSVIGWHLGETFGTGGPSPMASRWTSGQKYAFTNGAWELGSDGFINEPTNTSAGLMVAIFPSPDVDISCLVKLGGTSGTNGAGLAVRAIDATMFLALAIDQSQVAFLRRTVSGGAETVLATAPFSTMRSAFYNLRALVVGDKMVGYVDGVKMLEYTLTTDEMTAHGTSVNHGLFARAGANSRWHRPIVRRT